MTDNVKKLLKAYLQLPASERKEMTDALVAIYTGTSSVRKLEESLSAINFAPAPGNCPVCGK